MLVSVLTPSFNQVLWLADNLRSVSGQTYSSIEHIVMDGGSTDGSLDVLQEAGSSVRWESEPDRGQSHALNKAFDESSGEIIGWLNSDDAYVDRRSVEEAVKIFSDHPEIGVVYGHGLLVNQANRVLQFLWTPRYNHSALMRGTFFVQPSVFIRRSVIVPPLVNEELHYVMDRDLWWRLMDRTEFRRMDLVVGLDRHQPSRKTLEQGYPMESERYWRGRGIDKASTRQRLAGRAQKILFRMSGISAAVTGPKGIEPTIELEFGSIGDRIKLQAMTPRRKMPLA